MLSAAAPYLLILHHLKSHCPHTNRNETAYLIIFSCPQLLSFMVVTSVPIIKTPPHTILHDVHTINTHRFIALYVAPSHLPERLYCLVCCIISATSFPKDFPCTSGNPHLPQPNQSLPWYSEISIPPKSRHPIILTLVHHKSPTFILLFSYLSTTWEQLLSSHPSGKRLRKVWWLCLPTEKRNRETPIAAQYPLYFKPWPTATFWGIHSFNSILLPFLHLFLDESRTSLFTTSTFKPHNVLSSLLYISRTALLIFDAKSRNILLSHSDHLLLVVDTLNASISTYCTYIQPYRPISIACCIIHRDMTKINFHTHIDASTTLSITDLVSLAYITASSWYFK